MKMGIYRFPIVGKDVFTPLAAAKIRIVVKLSKILLGVNGLLAWLYEGSVARKWRFVVRRGSGRGRIANGLSAAGQGRGHGRAGKPCEWA